VVYEGFLSFLKGTALAMLWGANAWPLISVPQLPALVTVVALIVCQSTVMAVGQACMKHKVLAPASTGPADFECALRVQQNTLEQLVFSVHVRLAALATSDRWACLLGFFWVGARIAYGVGYRISPAKRGPGFGICFL
jgi:glutathione S-transferase